MSKFDGLALAVDTPSRMTIMSPIDGTPIVDAEKQPAWIDLLSLDSAAATAYQNSVTNSRLDRVASGQGRVTAEQLEQEAVNRLVVMTKGWRLLRLDGSELDVPFTEADAREVYSSPTFMWLRVQAEAYVARRANFMPAKSGGS